VAFGCVAEGVPPVTVRLIAPSQTAGQDVLVTAVLSPMAAGCETVPETAVVQPTASVIVTV
jgi:hypothetical protein